MYIIYSNNQMIWLDIFMVGRVSGVAGGRAREGVALLLSGWLMRCVVEWKEVSSRLMWVRVKIDI